MKKKIYFCNSIEQVPTAIGIQVKYPDLLVITPSQSVYSFFKKTNFCVKKISNSSRVVRPKFIFQDIMNWLEPSGWECFNQDIYEIYFSSFCDDLAFVSFLKNCSNKTIYVPLSPKRKIKRVSRFSILFRKQLSVQFMLSLVFLRKYFELLSVDGEYFLGIYPSQLTTRMLEIEYKFENLEITRQKFFNIELEKIKNSIFLLGYSYEHDVKAFGKRIVDELLKDLGANPLNILKLHPDSNIDQYISGNKQLLNLRELAQIDPDIPVELLIPFAIELRTIGSRVSLLFAKQNKKVFFYTSAKKENCGSNFVFNLSLKDKLKKYENVKFIEI